jgi:hypothetical protein
MIDAQVKQYLISFITFIYNLFVNKGQKSQHRNNSIIFVFTSRILKWVPTREKTQRW